MKRFINKKVVAIGVAAGLVLGGAGAALAGWSTTGSGSGSAKASSNVTSAVMAVTSPSASAGLWPGGPGAALSFTVDNPNPYPVSFSTWTSTETISTSDPTNCPSSNFLMAASGTVTGDASTDVPANTASASGVSGSTNADVLTMKSSAPDGCQGVTVTVDLALSGSQNT